MAEFDYQTWWGWENSGLQIMARIEGWDGALITQATLTTITYYVYDLETKEQVATDTLTIASVVYDTAQTDSGWPYSDGFNFATILPATCFPNGGRDYRVEVIFDPATGEDFPAVWKRVHAQDLMSA